MKKTAILWGVLMGVLCVLVIQHVRAFAAIPLSFKPNWLTIVPVIAIWAAFVGVVIRKQLAATEPRTRKAKAELVMEYATQSAGDPLRPISEPGQYVPLG